MERLDATGFGDIKIFQNPEDFCYGVDAVLLADFAARVINEKNLSSVIDLGSGTGIVPLILSHKTDAERLVGVEIQEKSFNTGLKSIEINGLEGRVESVNSNVTNICTERDELEKCSFDVVTANPPYTISGDGIIGDNRAKAIARHEIEGTLNDFVECAARLLRDKGEFFMVHRPSRLVDICCICRNNELEPKEVQMISGHPMEAPNILLVHCVKNGNKQLKILKPFAVRTEEEEYSEEINKIYERA